MFFDYVLILNLEKLLHDMRVIFKYINTCKNTFEVLFILFNLKLLLRLFCNYFLSKQYKYFNEWEKEFWKLKNLMSYLYALLVNSINYYMNLLYASMYSFRNIAHISITAI